MNLIAVVDKNWAIGMNGKQLVTIPEDMKFFRDETYGKVLVMGSSSRWKNLRKQKEYYSFD